ncbi:hypothetical protein, partial [Fischerella sp.]|uniref:hypothetical protein n=1 Tax=Fischerella sp. TaxID=1191 RepID=UPI0025BFCCEC
GGQDAPKFRTLWEAARRASTEEASARTSLHPTILLKLLWGGLLARTVFSLFMPFYLDGYFVRVYDTLLNFDNYFCSKNYHKYFFFFCQLKIAKLATKLTFINLLSRVL